MRLTKESDNTNKLTLAKYYIDSLCIYDLTGDEVIDALYSLALSAETDGIIKKYGEFFKAVAHHTSLKHHISKCVLSNDNIFTRSACAGTQAQLSRVVTDAVKADLKKLEEISCLTAQDVLDSVKDGAVKEILKTMPQWETGNPAAPLSNNWSEQLDALAQYHTENGYGVFARHIAFTWRDKSIVPIKYVDPITLSDLKNYEDQRKRVIDNTEGFVAGHPANNVLLYGDRGTGKSSTVHAILNEYCSQGLRMIEIPKSAVSDLTLIREAISGSPMKFIIYIDDLSFDSNDSSFSELKAALEGSLSGKQSNTLIYATSNRRHLIRESFSDRQNDINKNDIMQEQLSLSDRFGITITFLNPNKADYLDIVKKLAADRGLNVDSDELCFKAEAWATKRAGRSPRCAKQFIDHVQSCVSRNKEW